MPSYTLTGSAEKFVQVIAALESRRDEEEPETDRELYIKWLEGMHTELVFRHKRQEVQGAVAPDTEIVEVT